MHKGDLRFHVMIIFCILSVLLAGMIYPYLPGSYDLLAFPFSTLIQIFGFLGVLFVPVGIWWFFSKRSFWPAIVALVVWSFVMFGMFVVAMLSVGYSLGFFVAAVGIKVLITGILKVKAMRSVSPSTRSPLWVYLIAIPLVLLAGQFLLAKPLTESSRARAIESSAQLIDEIENYFEVNNVYPESLQAVWKDYHPNVVGVEKYHYVYKGNSYDLYFEQPRFFLDNFGTREFVVYNKFDDQTMISHTSWWMHFSPEQLEDNQGWYEVKHVGVEHWKYFWFD